MSETLRIGTHEYLTVIRADAAVCVLGLAAQLTRRDRGAIA
jgi:hypothetical protein